MSGGRRPALTLLAPLPIGLVQLLLARVVLGVPDWVAARDFLLSDRPTQADGLAAAQAVLWLVVGVALAAALTAAGRALATGGRRGRGVGWSVGVALAGLVILAAGAGHHVQTGSPSLAGGSLQQARAELAR
ncbi:MAG TPA: hypothetical protein VKF59_13950 [Candidatus Dormibacteraeota bacterium]|nr:hypothetical protein [Candidatus Dormibacteraeota bacterium]